MTHRSKLDDDIERRIAERDRLLARAQRASPRSVAAVVAAIDGPAVQAQLAARVAALEAALIRFEDTDWVSGATPDELAAFARAALIAARQLRASSSGSADPLKKIG